MRIILFAIAAILVAGCGRGDAGPPAVRPPIQPLTVGNLDQPVTASQPGLYEGQTAEQWAALLADQDPQVRQHASTALGALGDEGSHYLIQGLRSNSPEMVLNSLQGFYKPDLVRHADQTMPLVMGMLESRDAEIRLNAVSRLPWFEARGSRAMPMLQYLAANDPSPQVRAAAKESMVFINYSVTGVMPKHGH